MIARTHEEIPTLSQVECSDGICGTIVSVVIDPVEESVTHIVVKTGTPAEERLVPANSIESSTEGHIKLKLALAEVAVMPSFMENGFIKTDRILRSNHPAVLPFGAMGIPGFIGASGFYWPIAVPLGKRTESFKHENIPAGQLAIRRGTRVEAKDGYVGTVDEFVVDPDTCTISHLVLREANRRDTAIPYAAISMAGEKTVHLSLSKAQVAALPQFELQRRWES